MGWRNWFRKNTQLERRLILLAVLLCGTVIILIIVVLSSGHALRICNNPECVRAATHILDSVDPTIDPCDDFYNFACGNFLKNAFPLGQPAAIHSLQGLMKNQLKEIVIEKENKRNISRALLMQKNFYRKCINESVIEEDNDQTLIKLLDRVTGGWPVAKNYWEEGDFNWDVAMVRARKVGVFYEFYLRLEITVSNDSTYMLLIKPPYEDDIASFQWKDDNVDLMSEIATDLGARGVDRSREIRRTLEFAEELNRIVQRHYNNKDKYGENVRRENTTKYLDHDRIKIDWYDFLKKMTDEGLSEDDKVLFEGDDYFIDLYHLLLKTKKRIQANYMAWAIISTNVHYMTKKIRDKYNKMHKFPNGTETDINRSDLCYKISTDLFKYIAEGEYVRRYTPESKRKYISEMVKNIKTELESVLKQTSWMDEETKSHAVKHLQNITEEIGWTKVIYDAKKFEKLLGYHMLRITSNKLIDIARVVNINRLNRYYSQLWQTRLEEEDDYLHTPKLEVNAYYLTYFNKLILLAPLIQGSIFDERRPYYMNYGALGSIIGHEFIHGFIQFSSDGEIDKDTWWTNETIKHFKNTSQCIAEEYEKYSKISGLNIQNHHSVFEENVADFSSVNLAYTAYRKWVRQNSVEIKLPGIKYMPNQLFWIMTSTYLCEEPRLAKKDESKKKPKHAVPSYRVIGRLQNSPYFAEDFNCPIGSFMNPEKKCRILA